MVIATTYPSGRKTREIHGHVAMPNEQPSSRPSKLEEHLAAIGAAVKDVFTPRSVRIERAYERFKQAGIEADRRFDEDMRAADARINARISVGVRDMLARTKLKMAQDTNSL